MLKEVFNCLKFYFFCREWSERGAKKFCKIPAISTVAKVKDEKRSKMAS